VRCGALEPANLREGYFSGKILIGKIWAEPPEKVWDSAHSLSKILGQINVKGCL
jgi:hypothetical protein